MIAGWRGPAAVRGVRPAPPASARQDAGAVTVDPEAARRHPLGDIGPVLGLLIALLAVLGLLGMVRAVVYLDVIRAHPAPLQAFVAKYEFFLALLAVLAAVLALAGHRRFPAVLVFLCGNLCALALAGPLDGLLGSAAAPAPGLTAFQGLGLLLLPFVPYVLASRRVDLIYRQRLALRDFARLPALARPDRPDRLREPLRVRMPALRPGYGGLHRFGAAPPPAVRTAAGLGFGAGLVTGRSRGGAVPPVRAQPPLAQGRTVAMAPPPARAEEGALPPVPAGARSLVVGRRRGLESLANLGPRAAADAADAESGGGPAECVAAERTLL